MFGLECLDFEENSIISCQEAFSPITNIYMQCKLLVSFAIFLNHRRTFLLHISTCTYVKAEI